MLDPRNWSLRWQLAGFIALLLAAVSVFLVSFFPARMEALSRRSVTGRADEMTRVLSKALAPAIEYNDADYAREILRALGTAPEVRYAVVRRGDSSTLAALHADRAARARTGPTYEADHQVHASAAIRGGDNRGSIHIGYSLELAEREARDNFWSVLLVSLGVFGVGLVVSMLFGGAVAGPIREMTAVGLRIAEGDLTGKDLRVTRRDEVGQMAEAFGRMIAGQRQLVKQIAETAAQIAAAATQISAASQEQEAAGAQQSAAVDEVSRTMQSLLTAAAHIADSARGVLGNAERTRETTDQTARRITELSGHAGRIQEILDVIRDIADRSDLLALNASLEATRAGEAGRTFSLVAAEMRRLAERVTASVEDVKGLVADVRASGASTVVATEENRKLAEGTTESARQITMVTQQQRTGTEQVSQSLRDISTVIAESVRANQQTRASAENLRVQAERLATVVGRFRVDAS